MTCQVELPEGMVKPEMSFVKGEGNEQTHLEYCIRIKVLHTIDLLNLGVTVGLGGDFVSEFDGILEPIAPEAGLICEQSSCDCCFAHMQTDRYIRYILLYFDIICMQVQTGLGPQQHL